MWTSAASAAPPTVANPLCPTEVVFYDPGQGQDIVVPKGYKVSVFVSGLNFPTGIAFRQIGNQGNQGDNNDQGEDGDWNKKAKNFEVYILESGHGLPSICNDETKLPAAKNPFTPDILVFDQHGVLQRILGKPTDTTSETGGTNVFQPHGPSVDIAFEKGLKGGRLFATDSNQATHAHNGQNNSSRIVTVDPGTGKVTPFISQLPTGDHPTEQLAFKDGWIYWSQGSTTNSGVVGRDNGGGANQPDIPCQDIVLSKNVFDSGGGVFTSGYSPFGTTRPGATVKAFEGASHHGVCDGAILRAQLNAQDPSKTSEPFSWGYRNGYAIRFAPKKHPLEGGLLVGEDGADERGARPSNNAPDPLQLAKQNKDGTPDYHGWPDRYGFLPTSQSVYNPVGGPGDDLCVPDPTNLPSMCTVASVKQIQTEDAPLRDVLDHPPQQITSPLAIEAADSSFTGIDFVPDSFVVANGPVARGAAMYILEGDFGFSASNSAPPFPLKCDSSTTPPGVCDEIGHEAKIINFSPEGAPLKILRFAKNKNND